MTIKIYTLNLSGYAPGILKQLCKIYCLAQFNKNTFIKSKSLNNTNSRCFEGFQLEENTKLKCFF